MQIPVRHTIERIPGGMMVVPLLAGALIHTCVPHAAEFFGSFTGALFEGALPILAVFYVCIGSSIAVRSLPQVLRRGGALLGTKIALGIAAGLFLGHFLGASPVRAGWFAGLSTLAVVAAINDTNGGLYMALMNQYGRAEDAAAYSVMALESGPFLTMVTLGVAGLASFPWQTMLGAVLPLLIGIALGNLDAEMRSFLSGAAPVMIPFFAFALGATLNLKQIWAAGLTGIALGIAVLLLSAVALGLVDRLIGGTGVAGVAAATTAGNAAAVPALIAIADHKYAAVAASATVLVASSVVVTTILAPVLTAWWDLQTRRAPARWVKRRRRKLLAIADDLTGATDCAAACASSGMHAVVVLDGSPARNAELLVLDANTRCMGHEEAVTRVDALLLDQATDRIFFKKVDSTLRGHLAAELRAVLEARRKATSRRAVALLTPAFPAQRRTTLNGQVLVNGLPLDKTDLWKGEPQPPPSTIPELLANAGLCSSVVSLEIVRQGRAALEHDLLLRAREADVLVCDAETDDDLARVAQASLVLGSATVWAGSAGLARHLAQSLGRHGEAAAIPSLRIAAARVLFVVGSRSRISREQAEILAATGDVLVQRIPVRLLMAGAQSAEWSRQEQQVQATLKAGRDVLLLADEEEILLPEHATAVCAAMAQLLGGCSDTAGALVATGGQTARAVLDAWGITRLRLKGEVEPGLPFSVAEGWRRPIPILTKAGGFGQPDTLLNCRRFLRELESGAPVAREAAATE